MLAGSVMYYPRKRREVYCGNLTKDLVNEKVLMDAFREMFLSLPAYRMQYPDLADPIRSCGLPSNGQGMFAFVEFVDEVLASTAITMTGFELCGRPVKVGRPQGYMQAPFGEAQPLDVEPLRQSGLLPLLPDELWNPNGNTGTSNVHRELYFGNLTHGTVTDSIITEFLSPIVSQLSVYDQQLGPPILKVDMAENSGFCFVTFQNAELASKAMAIFDGTEFMGRKLRVARPSQYHRFAVLHPNGQHALEGLPMGKVFSELPPPPPPPMEGVCSNPSLLPQVPPPPPPMLQQEVMAALSAGSAGPSDLLL